MEESKKDKYKKFQVGKQDPEKTPTKRASTISKVAHKNKVSNSIAKMGNAMPQRVGGANYTADDKKKPFEGKTAPFKGKFKDSNSDGGVKVEGKTLKYEAGSGSIPSGTNTHIDKAKWGRRADGSSGPL